MPIPLPQAPRGGIELPHQPGDPPSLVDVKEARQYSKRVRLSNKTQMDGSSTENDVARAAVYETAVLVARSGGDIAPAWFGPAFQNALQEAGPALFGPMIDQALRDTLTQALTPIKQSLSKSINIHCNDGRDQPFEIVPFNDGTLPNAPPNELPALLNAAAICELTPQEATRYANGYGLGVINPAARRRKAIGKFIGCTVRV